MPIIYGNRKEGIKKGGTLDSAGNISVGGKDPTSKTGLSGIRNGATGYVSTQTTNKSGKNKQPKGTSSAPTTAPTTPASTWEYSASNPYNVPLSAETIANLASGSAGGRPIVFDQNGKAMYAPTQAPTTNIAGQADSIVNPMHGANQWSMINPYTGMMNVSGSNVLGSKTAIPGNTNPPTALSKFGDTVSKWLTAPISYQSPANLRITTGPDGKPVANMGPTYTEPRWAYGLEASVLPAAEGTTLLGKLGPSTWNKLTSVTRNALIKLGIKDGKQLETVINLGNKTSTRASGMPVNRATSFAKDAVYAGERSPGLYEAAVNILKTGGARIGAIGTGAAASNPTQQTPTTPVVTPGVMRNANPNPVGAITPEGTTQVESSSKTASSTPVFASNSFTSSPAGDTSSMSSMVGGGTSGVTGAPGATGVVGGASALRGETFTEQQAAAQARALELSRAQTGATNAETTPIGEQVSLEQLAVIRDRARAMLDKYGAEATTMPEFKTMVQQMLAGNIHNLSQLKATPETPVVETPAQSAYLQSLAPTQVGDTQAYMDQFRISQGTPELEKRKSQLNTQLEAINQTYQKVVDMIKDNPNLPKVLAARRLTEVFEDQKFAASSILAELKNIQDQLDTNNANLDRAFGYYKEDMSRIDKEKQKLIDQFGYFVDSKAIGGFSETDIKQWSEATGIPESAIRKFKETALDVKKDYSIQYEKNPVTGAMYAIMKDKNDLLSPATVEYVGNFGATKEPGTGEDSDISGLAVAYYSGAITAADIPSEQRNAVLKAAQDMQIQAEQLAQQESQAQATPSKTPYEVGQSLKPSNLLKPIANTIDSASTWLSQAWSGLMS